MKDLIDRLLHRRQPEPDSEPFVVHPGWLDFWHGVVARRP